MIAFITGGARSGKSELAEQLALEWRTQASYEAPTVLYIATAVRTDEEMEERIHAHLERRGSVWETCELRAASDLVSVLQRLQPQQTIMLDCMTIWLSRMLFEERIEPSDIDACWSECLQLIHERQLAAVIVSNDLNEGMPAGDAWTSLYIYWLEQLHRQTIAHADLAIQAVAGMPLVWKGEL